MLDVLLSVARKVEVLFRELRPMTAVDYVEARDSGDWTVSSEQCSGCGCANWKTSGSTSAEATDAWSVCFLSPLRRCWSVATIASLCHDVNGELVNLSYG